MNLLDKVNRMGAASVTPEEFKETWGKTQDEQVSGMMKFIKRHQFEAKAEEGKERCARILAKLQKVLQEQTERAAMLRNMVLARYPAMQFRNLDALTDEQKKQIVENMDILALLELEEDEQ